MTLVIYSANFYKYYHGPGKGAIKGGDNTDLDQECYFFVFTLTLTPQYPI